MQLHKNIHCLTFWSHKKVADFNLHDTTYAPENVVTSCLGGVFGLGGGVFIRKFIIHV